MDVFRKEYKALSEIQVATIIDVKSLAEKLYTAFTECPFDYDKRAMAIAKTNLEQAVMWATKAITE